MPYAAVDAYEPAAAQAPAPSGLRRIAYVVFPEGPGSAMPTEFFIDAADTEDAMDWIAYMERVGTLVLNEARLARHEVAAAKAREVFWKMVEE